MAADDFEDDGGTPMWRARQRQAPPTVVYESVPAGRWKRFKREIAKITLLQWVLMILVFGLAGPWAIIFGGLGLLGLWDWLTAL